MIATHELVVPKSIPMTLPGIFSSSLLLPAQQQVVFLIFSPTWRTFRSYAGSEEPD